MTVTAMTMGPGTLTLGDAGSPTSLSSQVTNCRVTPNVDTGDPINVLSGESVPGDRDETWVLAGTIVQDLGAVDGVAEWLFANRGTTVPFVFVPNTAAGKQFSGDVTVEMIEIGGDTKTKPTSDFEWQISGDPDLDDVTP